MFTSHSHNMNSLAHPSFHLMHTVALTHSHSHTHTHTHSHTLTHTHILTLTHTHILTLTHTLTLTEVEQLFPPVIIVQPETVFAELLESVEFLCTVEGNPQPSIRWFRDGVLIEDEVQQKLEIAQADLDDRGMYQCIATNDEGSVSSLIVVLNIDSKWIHCFSSW